MTIRINCNNFSYPKDQTASHFKLTAHPAIFFKIKRGKLAVAKHTYGITSKRHSIVCFELCRKEYWSSIILKSHTKYCDIPDFIDNCTIHDQCFNAISL